MPSKKFVAKCPYDACPMARFGESKVSYGYTISLYGCVYCDFNFVVAAATDANDNTRLVAQWSLDSTSGLYVLRKVCEHNPPSWVELACSALPKNRQPKQQEPKNEDQT
jgi:hypothetical protein